MSQQHGCRCGCHTKKGVPRDPFTALQDWMAAHVAAVAQAWDTGHGRASWEAYRQRYASPTALAPSASVRSAWLQQVRSPAIQHWTLAAALEQDVIRPADAIAYLRWSGNERLIPDWWEGESAEEQAA